MKTKFSTYDLICSIRELQRCVGMRVNQIYDIDHKTYLIKLQRKEEKCVLLLESGSRLHTTGFEWPKNVFPSGFSMKMRKHLKNKRLEYLSQLGIDRIVDMQFGSGEAAYHIILELYDRGNIVLTDHELTIINVLRPHTEGDKIRFVVREKYPVEMARQREELPSEEKLKEILLAAKSGEPVKKALVPHLAYGPAVIEHALLKGGFASGCKLGKGFVIEKDVAKLQKCLQEAEMLLGNAFKEVSKGYIIQKKEKRPLPNGEEEDYFCNLEFNPMLFEQHKNLQVKEFPSFDLAVDDFFSCLESQKIDMKAMQHEREAMKKLENVKKDHSKRLETLEKTQDTDREIGELITKNQMLVDDAIFAINSAIAQQSSWPQIQSMVNDAQANNDPIALCIKHLKLNINHITLSLKDPYLDSESDSENEDGDVNNKLRLVDVDLNLSAFANARKYYDQKRHAAKKQVKTIESQSKALKSAERKIKQTLKEVQAISTINKARKVYWFEKFFWFVSSENYLVIGGRDQIQNEIIVKRYMKQGDLYVHAEIQGASSVIIKNPSGEPVPPKTLNEAGVMATSYSVAWDAKVVTKAWWVHSDQVSKTAPTGEYLTTGSFMIRGQKNYLPPCDLILGFSFLFKLEESSFCRHKDERRVRSLEDEMSISSIQDSSSELDQEIEVLDSGDENENEEEGNDTSILPKVEEEEEEEEEVEEGSEEDNEEENGDKNEVNANLMNNINDEDSVSEDENLRKAVEFPDTEIRIRHLDGNKISVQTKETDLLKSKDLEEENVVYLGDDKPVFIYPSQNQKKKKKQDKVKTEIPKEVVVNKEEKTENKEIKQFKRGQRYKLKKIKEKYKDQDEEERRLRMQILQSTGLGKEKKSKKKKESAKANKTQVEKKVPVQRKAPQTQPSGEDLEDNEETTEHVTISAEVDMLDSLTGQPVMEDELLFAIPVVAPYNSLSNYKFKVKVTPGTARRGKAAKTAINVFLKDHKTTNREKDLIKSVKDENLAKNLPGKVKISAPQLQKLRK